MNKINVVVNGVTVEMLLEETMQAAPHSAAIMSSDGWVPMHFIAKRPKGRKMHLVYQSANTGKYFSIVSL